MGGTYIHRLLGEDTILFRAGTGPLLELVAREAQGRRDAAQAPARPLARSTLHRHLQRLGKTRRLTVAPTRTFHRFETKEPNELWMTDVKHGPYLPGEQSDTFGGPT